MNKQEALVTLLAETRRYEEPHEEVRAWPQEDIEGALFEAARELEFVAGVLRAQDSARARAQYRERLKRVAGAALALMVTEVEVVAGRSLDEWLAARENPVRTGVVVQMTSGGSYQPAAINGAMAREAYVAGVQDGRRGRA